MHSLKAIKSTQIARFMNLLEGFCDYSIERCFCQGETPTISLNKTNFAINLRVNQSRNAKWTQTPSERKIYESQ